MRLETKHKVKIRMSLVEKTTTRTTYTQAANYLPRPYHTVENVKDVEDNITLFPQLLTTWHHMQYGS